MASLDRRNFIKLLALLGGGSAAFLSNGCSLSSTSTQSPSVESTDNDLLVTLAVISDVHLTEASTQPTLYFKSALEQLNQFSRKPDAILVAGDLTDHGYTAEFDLFKKTMEESPFDTSDFILTMGNHEQLVTDNPTWSKFQKMHDNFVSYFQLPGLYYDTMVANEHIIVLAPDAYDENWLRFNISEAQLGWLDGLLKQDEAAGRRSFILCHEPIKDTIDGCRPNDSHYTSSLTHPDAMLSVVGKYPHAYYLSGHSHVYPCFSFNENGPTYINDGSCARMYRYVSNGTSSNSGPNSSGVILDIYKDHMDFFIRNFRDNIWENSPVTIAYNK